MCSRICASKSDVDVLLTKLKITPCPHCKKSGFLNRHGSLLGSTLNLMGNVVRGARALRVYCSDRNNSSGCGRTFSVWTADKIKYLFLSADCLLQFLSDAVSSGNIVQAFRNLRSGLNDPAAYRIWRRFLNAQVAIRTALLAFCTPPQVVSDCPAKLTLEHLSKAFEGHKLSPIAAFAATLQTFFI